MPDTNPDSEVQDPTDIDARTVVIPEPNSGFPAGIPIKSNEDMVGEPPADHRYCTQVRVPILDGAQDYCIDGHCARCGGSAGYYGHYVFGKGFTCDTPSTQPPEHP